MYGACNHSFGCSSFEALVGDPGMKKHAGGRWKEGVNFSISDVNRDIFNSRLEGRINRLHHPRK